MYNITHCHQDQETRRNVFVLKKKAHQNVSTLDF